MTIQIGIPRVVVLIAAAAAFVLSWSSGFIIAKYGTDAAPATTVLFWRFLCVAAILAVAALARTPRRGRPRPPTWRDARPHLLIGLLSQVGYVLPIYLAVAAGVSAGTVALIDAVQPLLIATLIGPLLGLRLRAAQWAGLLLGALGVTLIVGADAAATAAFSPAYLLPLISLASLVAGTFVERRTPVRLAVGTTLAVHSGVALFVFALLAAATGTLAPPASAQFWLATVLTAVFPTLMAYALYWYLLRRIGITPLNVLLYLVAPTTALAGTMLFGDPFTPATLAGLILGALAVLLVLLPPRRVAFPSGHMRRERRLPPS